jgi:ankyrin repeat protein/uncharacterized RDD family membrane protein YckC
MDNENTIKYANPLTRIIAFIIDVFLTAFITKALDALLPINVSLQYPTLFALFLYIVITTCLTGGTLGQKIIGIVIHDARNDRLGWPTASLRSVLVLVEMLVIIKFYTLMQFSDAWGWFPFAIYFAVVFLVIAPHFWRKGQFLHDLPFDSFGIDITVARAQKETVEETTTTKKIFRITSFQSLIRVLTTIAIVVFVGYAVFYIGVMYMVFGGRGQRSTTPDTTVVKTTEYNNTRIDFYKHELEGATGKFIEGDTMYDILHGYVARDLALNCIGYLIQKEGNKDWLEEMYAYRKNARSRYANTVERVKKANKNEDYMGHNFYQYDLNDVHSIEDAIANEYDEKISLKTCEQTVPVETMHKTFIVKYIANREEALQHTKREYSTTSSRRDKHFYKNQIAQIAQWLDILRQKNPDSVRILKENREIKKRQAEEAAKRKEKERIQKKQNALWKSAKDGSLYGIDFFKNIDANIKNKYGQTPLMIAVQNGYGYVVSSFAETNVNVWEKDSTGKTAFYYIRHPDNPTEKIYSKRMYGALRALEVIQIVKTKGGEIVQSSYINNTDMLSITIKGASCNDFILPENTQCYALKPPSMHKIFKAIKEKDNHEFEKLLPTVKDLSIRNKSGYTPLWASINFHNYYAMERLLESGANMYELDQNDLKTPVYWTAMINDVKALKILLKHGADVNSKNIFGDIALSTAMYKCQNFEAITLLLERGANPYWKNKYGETVFDKKPSFCKDKSQILKMEKLLHSKDDKEMPKKKKIDPNVHTISVEDYNARMVSLKKNKINAPIFEAIKFKQNINFDEYLKDLDSIDLKDEEGNTLLYIAVEKRNYYAMKKLLARGANMNYIDAYRTFTPFSYAVALSDTKAVKLFLKEGVDVNYQYKKSLTNLALAVKQCSIDIIKLLLSSGADSTLEDEQGDNAIKSLGQCNKKDNKIIESLIRSQQGTMLSK